MVAHVLRLRWALLLGAFRGGRGTTLRSVGLLAASIVATALVCVALLHLREATADVTRAVTVLAGAAAVAAAVVIPVVGGVADPLDPRRFALVTSSHRALAAALLAAAFLSIPALCLVAVGVCLVVLWTAHGAPIALAVGSAALGVATCVLTAKLAAGLTALLAGERRRRDVAGVVLIVVLTVAVPVAVYVAAQVWGDAVPSSVQRVVDVAALTPFGAAWAADGVGSLLVAIVTVAVVVGSWFLVVDRLLTTAPRPVASAEHRGLGWFAVLPANPTGAIGARSLTYWLTDSRYLVNVVIIPIAAVAVTLPLLLVGVPLQTAALIPAPLMALFFGWLPHNDLAYDSTALWMHVSAGVRGIADRVGRLAPILLISLPLLAVAVAATAATHGGDVIAACLVGVCASLFLCGLGVSSVAAVAAPYPVSPPGDSPFQQPQRTGGAAAQGLVLALSLVLSLPAMWWAWTALTVDPEASTAALWGGVGIGVAVAVVGVVAGGWLFGRRSSRLMEFAVAA